MYLYRPTHINLLIFDTDSLQGEEWQCIGGYTFQVYKKDRNTIEVMARRKNGKLQFTLDSTVDGIKRRGKWGEKPGEESPLNYMIEMKKGDQYISLKLSYNWKEREYDADFYHENGKVPAKLIVSRSGYQEFEELGHIHVQFSHWWPIARRLWIPLPHRKMIKEDWF